MYCCVLCAFRVRFTLCLLGLVVLSGRFSGIVGPFTRGDGEDVCVLFVLWFVPCLSWERMSVSCSSHAPRPVCFGENLLRLVRVMLLVPSVWGKLLRLVRVMLLVPSVWGRKRIKPLSSVKTFREKMCVMLMNVYCFVFVCIVLILPGQLVPD